MTLPLVAPAGGWQSRSARHRRKLFGASAPVPVGGLSAMACSNGRTRLKPLRSFRLKPVLRPETPTRQRAGLFSWTGNERYSLLHRSLFSTCAIRTASGDDRSVNAWTSTRDTGSRSRSTALTRKLFGALARVPAGALTAVAPSHGRTRLKPLRSFRLKAVL